MELIDQVGARAARARVRTWLKLRPMTRTEKIASVPLALFVLFLLFALVGVPPLRVTPVWGPSMQPTMAVWSLPAPFEGLSFSGWIHYDPDASPELGNIVYFRIPGTRICEVKRVAKIDNRGRLWVVPDNQGVSGEGSDNSDLYDWIPPHCVIGVVDAIYTPQRFFQQQSLKNELLLKHSPKDIFNCGEDILVQTKEGVIVYRSSGEKKFFPGFRLFRSLEDGYLFEKWENQFLCRYVKYKSGEIVARNLDRSGRPLPPDLSEATLELDGVRARGNIIYALLGMGWRTHAAVSPKQVSYVEVAHPCVIVLEGGGEADVVLSVWLNGQQTELFGDWGEYRVEITNTPAVVKLVLRRFAGHMDTGGGVRRITIEDSEGG